MEVCKFCVMFCRVLGDSCQTVVVVINNNHTSELIYFENWFITCNIYYAPTNVESKIIEISVF